MIKLAPSLLAADWLCLGKEIENMMKNGVQILHFDVMDAHFVPNLSFGPDLCKAVHKSFPDCRLDVHLMMDNPMEYIDTFAKAGAWAITVHREAMERPEEALRRIRELGLRCGLSVKPGTGAETLLPYISALDQILIMTVEPGFGGQKFMPEQMEKIRSLRKAGFNGDIAVDGGINMDNAPLVVQAGANMLVMGTAYFRAEDPARVARSIEELQ